MSPLLALLAIAAPQAPTFTDVSQAEGIAEDSRSYAIAVADFDRDLRPDLAISRHTTTPRLYKNTAGGLVDMSTVFELRGGDCHGIAWGDLVADFFPDLFVAQGADRGVGLGPNDLYVNLHAYGFQDLAILPGTAWDDPQGRGRGITPFDVNGDRILDGFLTNLTDGTRVSRYLIADGGPQFWSDYAAANGIESFRAANVSVLDLNDDGRRFAVFAGAGGDAGTICEMDGAGQLTDRTAQLGLASVGSRWPIQQIAPIDFDSDGDLDLYYVRGHLFSPRVEIVGSRLYYRAAGAAHTQSASVPDSGSFRIEVRVGGRFQTNKVFLGASETWLPSPVVNWTDAQLAGRPAFVRGPGCHIWHEGGELHIRTTTSGEGIVALIDLNAPGTLSTLGVPFTQPVSNGLYRNDVGTFVDVTLSAGLVDPIDSCSAVVEDFDNDGDLDIFVVTSGSDAVNYPDRLWLNNDDGTFSKSILAASATYGRGDAAAALDYDLDGDLDLAIVNGAADWPNNEGPIQLLRNDLASSSSATAYVIGGISNSLALGARIRIHRPDGRVQYRVKGYLTARHSHGLPPLHVGLEAPSQAIEVEYQSGLIRTTNVGPAFRWFLFE